MFDKLMYIPSDDTQNYLIKLVVETIELSKHSKVPKVAMPTNKKTLLLNFGD